MERVTSYSPVREDMRSYPSFNHPSSSSVQRSRFTSLIHTGVVKPRDIADEGSRIDDHVSKERWDYGSQYSPAFAKKHPQSERSFRDSTNSRRSLDRHHFPSGSRYAPPSGAWAQMHASSVWGNHSEHWHHRGREFRHSHLRHRTGGMVPISSNENKINPAPQRTESTGSSNGPSFSNKVVSSSQRPYSHSNVSILPPLNRSRDQSAVLGHAVSVVVIPDNIVIPKEISRHSSGTTASPPRRPEEMSYKRSSTSLSSPPENVTKRFRNTGDPRRNAFDKLDLLCSATLELGPLLDNPAGCSCPKSKCIALYCDCFKAGRRCNIKTCSCLNCKNTVAESGQDGARLKAIQSILARNPRAFNNPGGPPAGNKLAPGEQACNCIRSRCLKLYCTCFQVGKPCREGVCSCVGCLNTCDDRDGHREMAIRSTLEKRPDAFDKPKVKEAGSGCACKNNRCIRKYCECFRTELPCTSRCSCRDCQNDENAKHFAKSAL